MSFNLLHIWASMGLMSKIVAMFLLGMGALSLAVVIERWIAIVRGQSTTRRFLEKAGPLFGDARWDEAREVAASFRLSPFARLVAPVLSKMSKGDDGELSPVELARREAERQKEVTSGELRRGLGVLASVGSVAPFVGLLGTVVGIITAFQGIAATGSGGLGSVSAGIAEALVETALGLLVAIPAVLFFNQLNAKITTIESSLARASGELIDELENNHGLRSDRAKLLQAAE
jgi:biopolymer transport protein ExbB